MDLSIKFVGYVFFVVNCIEGSSIGKLIPCIDLSPFSAQYQRLQPVFLYLVLQITNFTPLKLKYD